MNLNLDDGYIWSVQYFCCSHGRLKNIFLIITNGSLPLSGSDVIFIFVLLYIFWRFSLLLYVCFSSPNRMNFLLVRSIVRLVQIILVLKQTSKIASMKLISKCLLETRSAGIDFASQDSRWHKHKTALSGRVHCALLKCCWLMNLTCEWVNIIV